MKKVILLIHCCLISLFVIGQDIIEVTDLGSLSKEEIAEQYGTTVLYDVNRYKVRYTTPDVQGALDTASGLFVLPLGASELPILCYQHGTVNGREDVPSRLSGGDSQLAIVFGGMGYAVTAADYLGLGDARGVHPYVHADSEASAAIDMIRAIRSWDQTNDEFALLDYVFITGYSQGGHAAMATHRSMEQDFPDEFNIVASAPMSGPYSISEKMVDFTIGENQYLAAAYLGWVALSYQAAYGNIYDDLEEIFKPLYIPDIISFQNEEIDLMELNSAMLSKLFFNGGFYPGNMLQDSIRQLALMGGDHPFVDALKDNDVYQWAPQAPTRLYYCTADETVTYENSILADSVMNALGAVDLESVDVFSEGTHGTCVEPAVTATLEFFSETFTSLVSVENEKIQESVVFFPNPTSAIVNFNFPEDQYEWNVEIIALDGKLLQYDRLDGVETSLNVENLDGGLYILRFSNSTHFFTKKLMIK